MGSAATDAAIVLETAAEQPTFESELSAEPALIDIGELRADWLGGSDTQPGTADRPALPRPHVPGNDPFSDVLPRFAWQRFGATGRIVGEDQPAEQASDDLGGMIVLALEGDMLAGADRSFASDAAVHTDRGIVRYQAFAMLSPIDGGQGFGSFFVDARDQTADGETPQPEAKPNAAAVEAPGEPSRVTGFTAASAVLASFLWKRPRRQPPCYRSCALRFRWRSRKDFTSS